MESAAASEDVPEPENDSGEMTPGRVRTMVQRYLPIVRWLSSYKPDCFKGDCVAAVSVWALLVPQALAYSSIAGVPVQYGLYTAFAALLAYALFGTSRQLVQGPSAAVAAVSAAVVLPLVGSSAMGTDAAVPVTAALALVTGVVYLALGVARMGWVSNFLSKAVMAGFVFGLSVGIIIDQSHKLLGVPGVDGSYAEILIGTIEEIPDTNGPTLVLGMASLAVLLLMRRYLPAWPRALIVVVVSILAVTAFDLTAAGVAVTGDVPTGLFDIGIPWGSFKEGGALLVGALSIIFVGYSETLASGRAMAAKNGYEIDADQELIAEGMACAAAGMVGGYVSDGSLSKTSVADAAGQKSQMASLINAGFVLLTMLALAALFENLPSAVLGAVVIDAMVGLIDLGDSRRYRRVNRADWACFLAAALGIFFSSITVGIAIGVILSLLLLVARASKPGIRRLGRDPATRAFRDAARHPEVQLEPGELVVRMDGPLFFANANRFRDDVNELVAGDPAAVSIIVADMEAVSQTDTDGADILVMMAGELSGRGIWFGMARVEGAVRDRWELAGAIDAVGVDRVFPDIEAAVSAARSTAPVPDVDAPADTTDQEARMDSDAASGERARS